jgi:hypothetical protein
MNVSFENFAEVAAEWQRKWLEDDLSAGAEVKTDDTAVLLSSKMLRDNLFADIKPDAYPFWLWEIANVHPYSRVTFAELDCRGFDLYIEYQSDWHGNHGQPVRGFVALDIVYAEMPDELPDYANKRNTIKTILQQGKTTSARPYKFQEGQYVVAVCSGNKTALNRINEIADTFKPSAKGRYETFIRGSRGTGQTDGGFVVVSLERAVDAMCRHGADMSLLRERYFGYAAVSYKNEALDRMRVLGLNSNCVNLFRDENRLTMFDQIENEVRLPTDDELELVRDIERSYGVMVYALILTHGNRGNVNFLAMLCVEDGDFSWDYVRDAMKRGYVYAYVHNYRSAKLCEFGDIVVDLDSEGNLRRIG